MPASGSVSSGRRTPPVPTPKKAAADAHLRSAPLLWPAAGKGLPPTHLSCSLSTRWYLARKATR